MKSVFDGWTKKIEHIAQDGKGGYCAVGWLNSSKGRVTNYVEVRERIGEWIRANLDPPDVWTHKSTILMYPARNDGEAIIWANNECKLDIEGFKMVDLLTRGYLPEEVTEEVEEQE